MIEKLEIYMDGLATEWSQSLFKGDLTKCRAIDVLLGDDPSVYFKSAHGNVSIKASSINMIERLDSYLKAIDEEINIIKYSGYSPYKKFCRLLVLRGKQVSPDDFTYFYFDEIDSGYFPPTEFFDEIQICIPRLVLS